MKKKIKILTRPYFVQANKDCDLVMFNPKEGGVNIVNIQKDEWCVGFKCMFDNNTDIRVCIIDGGNNCLFCYTDNDILCGFDIGDGINGDIDDFVSNLNGNVHFEFK